jgi:F-type H+-transporting ATPase subunit b
MLTFPPDYTFVIQIVSFLLLWVALKKLTFDPMLQVLAQRDARTRGSQREAEELRANAQTAEHQYESSLREVRHRLLEETEAERKRAEQEQQRLLSTARAEAEAELAQLRRELASQVATAESALATEARALAGMMAERATGRSVA